MWAMLRTTTTLAAITASTVTTSTIRTWFAIVFLLVDPAFDTDDSVDGAGFCKTVVERDPEGLERHLAFAVAFGTGNISTTEATAAADADTFGTEFHGSLDGALHGAAERNPALELDSDLLGDKLSVELRFADFEDIEFDLGFLADFLDLVGHDLDLLALTADDQTWT